MSRVYIYALLDLVTQECRYVGKTMHSITKRLAGHKTEAFVLHKPQYKNSWMRACGAENIECIVLEEVGADWADAEQFWIAYMKALGARLTNLTLGGEGMAGLRPSVATRLKMSESRKGKKLSQETKAKISAVHKGRKQPPEMLEKLSLIRKGRKLSEEHKAKIGKAGKGRKHTEATLQKMSNSQKGRIVTTSHRLKLSLATKEQWRLKREEQATCQLEFMM